MSLSHARGAGWLYVTDLGGDNPYAAPPGYWNAETEVVASQGIQAPYATARPASTDESGNAVPAKISFRWKTDHGTHWKILCGPSAAGAVAEAQERIEVGANGKVRVFSRNGGQDWVEINVHAVAISLADHVHLVELDSRGLPESLTYQIRSFDNAEHVLSVSIPSSMSMTNHQYIFDVSNH